MKTVRKEVIEEAILHINDNCDGANSEDGAGWNKLDTRFGHSIADQIRKGRPITFKQRQALAKMLRKYRRQIPDWESIRPLLKDWITDAQKQQEFQKKRKKDEQPTLSFNGKHFIFKTSYKDRHLKDQIPTKRWNKTEKSWTCQNNYDNRTAFCNLVNDGNGIEVTQTANEALMEHSAELLRKEQAKEEVKEIKQSDSVDEFEVSLKTKPFDHQLKAMKISTTLDHSALLMEQGTGKTLAAIGTAAYRHLKGEVKRLLVVAPKSVLPEWARQFEEHTDIPYKAYALNIKGKKKAEVLKDWEDGEGINIITINYESTWRLKDELIKWNPDMVILDESQNIKNGQAKQSKACRSIGKAASYRMILTGTPVSQSPLDFFSQYQFLDDTIFGNSFVRFRDRYAIMGGYGGYKVVGYKNEKELASKAHSIAYRVKKSEAIDLPEEVTQTLKFQLEPKAMKAYKEFAKEALYKFEEQEVELSAPIVLTKLLRLQQIAGGFIKDEESGDIHQVSNAKLNLLKETLDDLLTAGKKTFIVCKYLPEIEAISEYCSSKDIKHVTLTGKTADRKKVLNDFQNDPDTKVIIIQISTGGVGVTLTAADTSIFYSTGYSLNDYEQAKARIHRIGQKNKVTHIHLVAENTVDEEVIEALKSKKQIADLVVDDLKNLILKEESTMAKKKGKKSLDDKLNKLKDQIENGEEPEIEVNDNPEEVETEAEEKPKKKASKKKKAGSKKSTEKPKASKKKASKKKPETDGEVVTAADLAEELGMSPTSLRKRLRSEGIEKPGSRWEWPTDHADLEKIRNLEEE